MCICIYIYIYGLFCTNQCSGDGCAILRSSEKIWASDPSALNPAPWRSYSEAFGRSLLYHVFINHNINGGASPCRMCMEALLK